MNPAKHKRKILDYCEKHGSITIREACEILKINSPTKTISDMRKSADYSVDDIWEHIRNDEGKVEAKYKRYFITAPEGGVS